MIKIPHGSIEYVTANVTADVDLDMIVAIAVTPAGAAHTWLSAEWVGALGPARQCRTATPVAFITPAYTPQQYTVFVRLTDSPEVPIIDAGILTLA